MRSVIAISSAILLPAMLSACAVTSDTVVFVTKTSVGIDVDSSTPGASFAYDRVEGYVAPRYSDSNIIPQVYASFGSNGDMIYRNVRHVYATGNAARIIASNAQVAQNNADKASIMKTASLTVSEAAAASPAPEPAAPPAGNSNRGDARPMFFGTTTTLGFKFSTGVSGGDNFVLGFKRKELSVIPGGDPTAFPSIVALYKNDLRSDEDRKPEGAVAAAAAAADKVRPTLAIRQFFATGVAADSVAANDAIRNEFDQETNGILNNTAQAAKPQPPSQPAIPAKVAAPAIAQASLAK